MTDQEVLNEIAPKVALSQFKFDETYEYEIDQSNEWLDKIFNELEEQTDRSEEDYKEGFINTDFTLKRKSAKPFGDHLFIKGHVSAKFLTPCVRCLELTEQHVNSSFQGCFVHIRNEKEPEFEELDEVFAENDQWDLHFYDKGQADIAATIHEVAFINKDHFPLHHEDCKGLCPQCGHNLNESDCPKHPQKQ